ncbi:helix-turn-helix domain-containing protein [Synechococcales cyanobacterium C]|uniref:Helix-turn-helix domain-containing protein n=1 Tax=Petrachloros mirabilis ULC683 TaxID=2781853 RepID=A0A8K2A6I8_9CYAN|nr:AraC family transcriptional regulator [Petrachloros mirabilis]NCJ05931.1 helix-turn-helix domain-containing protein [Petrachloros mirabilis ULC683]
MMTLTLTSQDYLALFDEAANNGEIAQQESEFETFCEYPPLLGQGYRRSYQLRSGLSVSIHEHTCRDGLTLKIPEQQWSVGMFFHIAGDYRCDCGAYVNAGHTTLTGQCVVPKETLEYRAQERLSSVYLHIDPALLRELVMGYSVQFPTPLRSILEEIEDLIKIEGMITPAMQVALQQIFQCPYQGTFKRLYLEGKVLELIALQLNQIVDQDSPLRAVSSLSNCDLDCIHQARDILLNHAEAPPSLLDLARQVGINDRKLKQGFRDVFHTSPFAYLRQHRLEQARQLLSDPDLPIGVVAKRVGYGDRSAFATAFRKQFGLNPKAYQLQWRREI